MATPPSILATMLGNVNTTLSTLRVGLTNIRPLYNMTTVLTGRAVAPAGITTGILGFGLLGYIPSTISNIQALQRLQSFAQTGIRAPAGFSLPY
jgi:hypothetical protein